MVAAEGMADTGAASYRSLAARRVGLLGLILLALLLSIGFDMALGPANYALSDVIAALIDADSDQIIGFTAVGAGASELIAVVQMAMLANLPYTALRDAILTHPTMAEGLTVLFANSPSPPVQGRV